jgi:hypothetical protein
MMKFRYGVGVDLGTLVHILFGRIDIHMLYLAITASGEDCETLIML